MVRHWMSPGVQVFEQFCWSDWAAGAGTNSCLWRHDLQAVSRLGTAFTGLNRKRAVRR